MEPATTESRSLTGQELAQYRVMARTRLKELEATAKKSSPSSWIRPDGDKAWLDRRSDQCRYFDTHGFLVVKGFVDRKTVQALKDQMADLADNDWDPSQSLPGLSCLILQILSVLLIHLSVNVVATTTAILFLPYKSCSRPLEK